MIPEILKIYYLALRLLVNSSLNSNSLSSEIALACLSALVISNLINILVF
jgi:hypothetical protein